MNEPVRYFDHAATTHLKSEVLDVMLPFLKENFGNASSIYSMARVSKQAVEAAREKVACAIGADAKEIYFTSSGSEANNWAIRGVMAAHVNKGRHMITSAIEHPAVLEVCKMLQKEGAEVTYLPVDSDGKISLEDLKRSIRPDTVLMSIMFANNEIGTIQPVLEIGKIARAHGVYFHTDAVQAVGSLPIHVKDMQIDLLTMSAHKFYGPKGVGALYINKTTKIAKLLHGGHQERGLRPGTENVAGIVGLGEAIRLAVANMESYQARLTAMRDKLYASLLEKIPHTRLNGHPTERLANNLNVSFGGIEGESLLMMLDMKGVCASSGSACSSGSLEPSHVLLAIGLPYEIAQGALRLTLGDRTSEADIQYLLEVLPEIVGRLRHLSPVYEKYIKETNQTQD